MRNVEKEGFKKAVYLDGNFQSFPEGQWVSSFLNGKWSHDSKASKTHKYFVLNQQYLCLEEEHFLLVLECFWPVASSCEPPPAAGPSC